MVVHVGLDPWYGNLSLYKDAEKKTEDLEIKQVRCNKNDKVIALFKEIKILVKDELGYLCICLNKYHGNNIRKLFIKEGLNCGFRNVEIINLEVAFYLDAQTNFTPLNANIIWIYWNAFISVWEIKEQKAKYCGCELKSVKLSENTNINFTFQINTNGIYFLYLDNSYNFSNERDTKLEKKGEQKFKMHAKIEESFSLLPRHLEALNLSNCFVIPKKEILLKADFQAAGIDLGTSRCCVAVNRNGVIVTIPLDNSGERLLPSYIAYNEENIVCGKVVVNRLRNYSKSTIFDSKRIIGRSFNDIEIDEYWCFNVNFENEKVLLEVTGFNGKKKKITAEEVAADLLKYMKNKAEEFQGEKIAKVVITIPAAFTEFQKSATISAAKLAGWNEIQLLPEPIAAAFAYFIDRPVSNNSTILLFDLGGGTL
uniref:Heat shock protein 70 n=1 Tax=Panagrolaimus sp. ES5 TaxID=591445 RepID=A0AC34G0K9_9BILA